MLCPIVLGSGDAESSFTVDALDVALDEAFEVFEEARDVAFEEADLAGSELLVDLELSISASWPKLSVPGLGSMVSSSSPSESDGDKGGGGGEP